MATPIRLPNQIRMNPISTSSICKALLKSVFLYDWWLIRVEADSNGRQLGVGGFLSRGRQGRRAFVSAAIAKRYDTVSLETVDGFIITFCGFINKSQTYNNGFPFEVCNHFSFGFPHNWGDYATKCYGENPTHGIASSEFSDLDKSSMPSDSILTSLDDLSATQIRDLSMFTLENSETCVLKKIIFNDITHQSSDTASKNSDQAVQSSTKISEHSMVGNSTVEEMESSKRTKENGKNTCQIVSGDFVVDDIPRNCKRTKIGQKLKDEPGPLCATEKLEKMNELPEIGNQPKLDVDECNLREGVSTRNMTRLKNLTIQKGNDTSRNKHGVSVTRSDKRKISHANLASEEEVGVRGVIRRNNSAVRITRRNASNISHATLPLKRNRQSRRH